MKKRMMTRAAIAAALLCGTPGFAAGTPVPTDRAAFVPSRVEPAVEAFYAARGDRPLWLADQAATEALLASLRRAELDGFDAGPQLAAQAETALHRATTGDKAAAASAERLLASAWVSYRRALRASPTGMTYTDPRLNPRPRDARLVLGEAASARSLARHVRDVSAVNPVYAELRDAAWNAMQATGRTPDRRILLNLERARFMPKGERYIMVDAAGARLLMIEDGEIRDSMKVIVGKASSPTPMIASNIYYATLNPYWNVPSDLVRTLIAPRVVQDGPSYLKARGYEVLSGYEEDADLLAPDDVDWKAVVAGRQEVRVRQRPGAANSMGRLKFSLHNAGGIYLHDTPNKDLFDEADRDVSNGCIRVEDADRLGRWLLGRDPSGAEAPEQHVALSQPVPVYVTYLTARAEHGRIALLEDVYGRDRGTPQLASTGW